MISRYKIAEAWSKQKLVAGALKSAHVYRSYTDYEDLFQEGILVYAKCLASRDPHLSDEEVDRLAFKKVLWRTLDLLKKNQRRSDHQQSLEAAFLLPAKPAEWPLALKIAWQQLPDLEKIILGQNLIQGYSLKETADLLNLPYRTTSRIKKQALEKLRQQLE